LSRFALNWPLYLEQNSLKVAEYSERRHLTEAHKKYLTVPHKKHLTEACKNYLDISMMNLMVLYRRKAKAFFVALLDTIFEMVRIVFGKRICQLIAA